MRTSLLEIKLHEHFDVYFEDLSEKARKLVRFKNNQSLVLLPATVDWCSSCDGAGTRSVYDIEGYDMNAMIYDEDGIIDHDFADDYFSGRTDTVCPSCQGAKIENVVAFDKLNDLQHEIMLLNHKIFQEGYLDREEAIAERRMGA